MIRLVLYKVRHLLSRSVLGSSLAGDGLLVRLRSTSIGLLGVVTAVCLGLIAFIAQLGWPGAFNAPIPAGPREAGTVHDAIALTQQAPRLAPSGPGSGSRLRVAAPSHVGRHATSNGPTADSGLSGSRQLAAGGDVQAPAPVESPSPTRAVPAPPGTAPAPVSQPLATVPAAPSTPQDSSAGETPKSSSVGGSKDESTSKWHWHGTASHAGKGDAGDKPGSPGPAKPKEDLGSGKTETKPHAPASDAPEYSPVKPEEDQGGTPPKAVAPPAATPPSKDAPEAGGHDGPDGGKDYGGDWGKSDRHHH